MNGRAHPYALAWEVEHHDGLESDTGGILLYTMPALFVRDQGYQPQGKIYTLAESCQNEVG